MALDTQPELPALKAERDALNDRIALIEKGIERAAYDANLAWQLSVVNDVRERDGEPKLTMSQFLAGGD